MSPTLRGVHWILTTPFDQDGRIDEQSLRRLIDDARVRHPGASIDPVTREELFALIERVQPTP